MITNEGGSEGKGAASKVRVLGGLVLVAVISYEMGLSHGRAERSAREYAELRTQYLALKADYDRDFTQYSAMKSQYDQTLAQYGTLKAQYDRIEAKRNKTQ